MYRSDDSGADEYHKALVMERCATPREHYTRLRSEKRIDFDDQRGVAQLIHRDDVEQALRNPQLYSSVLMDGDIMGSTEPVIPLNVDPPEHVRYRRLLDPLFAPKKMALLKPAVLAHTNKLIDSFIDKGECDFSSELAVPLPCSTFLSLLGLPVDELPALVRWKDIMIRAQTLVDDPDEAKQLQATTAMDIYARFAAEMAERRARPREDLITFLTQAEIDNSKLSDSEILRICFLLLAAGLDTVTISLECIFAFLTEHPDARAMLAQNPGSENALIEELLRWETPVQTVGRFATQDHEIGGCPIKKGQQILVSLSAANTDPNGLAGADEVDVTRSDMRNFAFGGGPHRCLGSNLARMELRTVVRAWHDRIPDYGKAPGATFEWNGSLLRGIDHLPLVFPKGGR